MDCNTIGGRIKTLRENKKLTQADVAKDLRVKRQTVDMWENGKRDLKTLYTIKLADYFGVTCDEILRGIKPENVAVNRALGLSNKAIEVLYKRTDYANQKTEDSINYLIENAFNNNSIVSVITDYLSVKTKDYILNKKTGEISEIPQDLTESIDLSHVSLEEKFKILEELYDVQKISSGMTHDLLLITQETVEDSLLIQLTQVLKKVKQRIKEEESGKDGERTKN